MASLGGSEHIVIAGANALLGTYFLFTVSVCSWSLASMKLAIFFNSLKSKMSYFLLFKISLLLLFFVVRNFKIITTPTHKHSHQKEKRNTNSPTESNLVWGILPVSIIFITKYVIMHEMCRIIINLKRTKNLSCWWEKNIYTYFFFSRFSTMKQTLINWKDEEEETKN